jgi:Uma2 family endonuclease
MSLARRKVQERFSYADYLRWPEDERWELIDGEAYAMVPAPTPEHQELAGELFFQIRGQLAGKACRPYLAPFDVRLGAEGAGDAETYTTVQPDLSVICDRSRIDAKGCRGAPDWIIEVISPSTAVRDQITKRDLYERHGVREYWIVHPTDRVLTIYRRAGAGFGPPLIQAAAGIIPCGLGEGLVINWDALFQALAPPDATPTQRSDGP